MIRANGVPERDGILERSDIKRRMMNRRSGGFPLKAFFCMDSPILEKSSVYGISNTGGGQLSGLFFFIGVLKIFGFQVMFFDKVVKIGPVFSRQFSCLTHIALREFKEANDVSPFELFHGFFKRF